MLSLHLDGQGPPELRSQHLAWPPGPAGFHPWGPTAQGQHLGFLPLLSCSLLPRGPPDRKTLLCIPDRGAAGLAPSPTKLQSYIFHFGPGLRHPLPPGARGELSCPQAVPPGLFSPGGAKALSPRKLPVTVLWGFGELPLSATNLDGPEERGLQTDQPGIHFNPSPAPWVSPHLPRPSLATEVRGLLAVHLPAGRKRATPGASVPISRPSISHGNPL